MEVPLGDLVPLTAADPLIVGDQVGVVQELLLLFVQAPGDVLGVVHGQFVNWLGVQ